MMIWYYAYNASTYDNNAYNDEIFIMKNCFDIHDLIFHLCYLSLSWFEDCSKRKWITLLYCYSSFFANDKGGERIASVHITKRGKLASLLISKEKQEVLSCKSQEKQCLLSYTFQEDTKIVYLAHLKRCKILLTFICVKLLTCIF